MLTGKAMTLTHTSVIARLRYRSLEGGWSVSNDSLQRAAIIRAFPENALKATNTFSNETTIKWLCISPVKFFEQYNSWTVFSFSSPVKLYASILPRSHELLASSLSACSYILEVKAFLTHNLGHCPSTLKQVHITLRCFSEYFKMSWDSSQLLSTASDLRRTRKIQEIFRYLHEKKSAFKVC